MEARCLMSDLVQSKREVKEHAAAAKKAADYFLDLARRSELPMSPVEFDERVRQFFTQLDARLGEANALALAALEDRPVPQSFFAAWASKTTIWRWRSAKNQPLKCEDINGQIMIRPSDFFRALELHGRAAA